MKISRDLPLTFWIVTYPTKDSELYDIVCESNFTNLMIQTSEGLSSRKVYGIFSTREEAFEYARYLVKYRDRVVGSNVVQTSLDGGGTQVASDQTQNNREITKKLFPSARTKKY